MCDRQAFYTCEQIAVFDGIPWNVYRCVCSGVEAVYCDELYGKQK